MASWYWLYVGSLVLSCGISAALVGYTWRNRDRRGAIPLLINFTGPLLWQLSTLLAALNWGTPAALFWTRTSMIGSGMTVVGFLLFALVYTGREHLATVRTGVLLSVVPVAAAVVALTNPLHGYFWTVGASNGTEVLGYTVAYGPVFYGDALYGYAVLVVGTGLLLSHATDAPSIYRYQTTAFLVAVCVPWAAHVTLALGVVTADPVPVAFAVSGIALWWAIFRAGFLDLAPIGRKTVIDDLYDGVFTIDRDHRLVDVNPAGRRLFGFDEGDDVVGRHVDELLSEFPEIRDLYWSVVADEDGTAFETELGGRHYAVEVLPLGNADGTAVGRTVHVRDVTDRRRRERKLQEKNERLERFASIVSHDLRNPLNVIQGRVELAEHDDDPDPHLESIATNADRMDAIIEDVLAVTRDGEIGDRDRVAVATLARRAWEHVDTGDATLETPASRVVTGDPDRLVQLFENLFRNAVEHGSTSPASQARQDAVEHGSTGNRNAERSDDAVEHGSTDEQGAASSGASVENGGPGVTVTVGDLDDTGFFVADDGPGIPPDERDRVLEDGYTTSEDGTGLGLSIVSQVVDAHEWDLAVTDSDTGGARFEVRCDVDDQRAATESVGEGTERP